MSSISMITLGRIGGKTVVTREQTSIVSAVAEDEPVVSGYSDDDGTFGTVVNGNGEVVGTIANGNGDIGASMEDDD